jgi:hypothetical protein
MNYINKHSELKPRFDSILTHRLMQTVHGDKNHPQQPYQYIFLTKKGFHIDKNIFLEIYIC